METKTLHKSWETTAKHILEEDMKDLSDTERDIILRLFLRGAETFMNQARSELDALRETIKLIDPNYEIIARSAVGWAKGKIENCEIHFNK